MSATTPAEKPRPDGGQAAPPEPQPERQAPRRPARRLPLALFVGDEARDEDPLEGLDNGEA